MLTKPTDASNLVFQILWSENADDIFVVFRENTVKAMEIVLWHNKNVLLDVELFHARTWAFAFAQFSLYSLFCGSLVTQNVFIEKEKT